MMATLPKQFWYTIKLIPYSRSIQFPARNKIFDQLGKTSESSNSLSKLIGGNYYSSIPSWGVRRSISRVLISLESVTIFIVQIQGHRQIIFLLSPTYVPDNNIDKDKDTARTTPYNIFLSLPIISTCRWPIKCLITSHLTI